MFLDWVLFNISHMQMEVLNIANAVIAESPLPYRELKPESLANFSRRASFDELHSPFESNVTWREQYVKVIGHQHILVQSIGSFIAIMLQRFDKNFAWRRGLEDSPALPGARSHEVCSRYARMALRNGHSLSG